MSDKRDKGQYFTVGNPFNLRPFRHWAAQAGLPKARLLEPFAGANHIVHTLQAIGLCKHFESYDTAPADSEVQKQDTLESFPKHFDVCVTNPPWLARNSATRRGLPFPQTAHDDLYKHCLELCLDNCQYVGAIIPASYLKTYLQTGLFEGRLATYVLLHETLFADTENPVCLALFTGKENQPVNLYYDGDYIGTLNALRRQLPIARRDREVVFNDPHGQLGFISFDNTEKATIRFCEVEEISEYEIKTSSRFITRISGQFDNLPKMIDALNREIATFRERTRDVFLTPFKGMRKDGRYRRRMDFALARDFINAS